MRQRAKAPKAPRRWFRCEDCRGSGHDAYLSYKVDTIEGVDPAECHSHRVYVYHCTYCKGLGRILREIATKAKEENT